MPDTGMPAPRAIGATDAVSAEVSGPRIKAVSVGDGRLGRGGGASRGAAGVEDIQRRAAVVLQGKLGGLQQDLAKVRAWTRQREQNRDCLPCSALSGRAFGPSEVGAYDPDWYPAPYRPEDC